MTRQIGVRAYVSEPAAHKSFTHRDGLRPAVLQDEPAAGLQVCGRLRDDLLDRFQARDAGDQRNLGFEAADVLCEVLVAARDVGRIRGYDLETPARERGKPAAALEADVGQLQPRRIALRDLE